MTNDVFNIESDQTICAVCSISRIVTIVIVRGNIEIPASSEINRNYFIALRELREWNLCKENMKRRASKMFFYRQFRIISNISAIFYGIREVINFSIFPYPIYIGRVLKWWNRWKFHFGGKSRKSVIHITFVAIMIISRLQSQTGMNIRESSSIVEVVGK